jgi:hypothetical protein
MSRDWSIGGARQTSKMEMFQAVALIQRSIVVPTMCNLVMATAQSNRDDDDVRRTSE